MKIGDDLTPREFVENQYPNTGKFLQEHGYLEVVLSAIEGYHTYKTFIKNNEILG